MRLDVMREVCDHHDIVKLAAVLLLSIAGLGCGDMPPAGHSDIVGPFTGLSYRFVVDSITLPLGYMDFADDLDNGPHPENQLGAVCSGLENNENLTFSIPSMLAARAIKPELLIQTDDPAIAADPTVQITLDSGGQRPIVMGASLEDGVAISNRTRYTTHPAIGDLVLPVVLDAAPLSLEVEGVEIDLMPDSNGGIDGVVRGGIAQPSAAQQTVLAVREMVTRKPWLHRELINIVDINQDGVLSDDEILNCPFIAPLLTPDLKLHNSNGAWHPEPSTISDERDAISFGFAFHAIRCDAGDCVVGTPQDRCEDRIRDGGDSDVDCGGRCSPCPGGATCNSHLDCQTPECVTGTCAAPTCSDGQWDGFETGVDCGDNCPPC